jgi:hypothetical protein
MMWNLHGELQWLTQEQLENHHFLPWQSQRHPDVVGIGPTRDGQLEKERDLGDGHGRALHIGEWILQRDSAIQVKRSQAGYQGMLQL